jgi:betaine reductase
MSIFKDKKIVIIGDRDGIPAPAVEKCLEGSGADIVFSSTECFV